MKFRSEKEITWKLIQCFEMKLPLMIYFNLRFHYEMDSSASHCFQAKGYCLGLKGFNQKGWKLFIILTILVEKVQDLIEKKLLNLYFPKY